jgi:hypothetical protein
MCNARDPNSARKHRERLLKHYVRALLVTRRRSLTRLPEGSPGLRIAATRCPEARLLLGTFESTEKLWEILELKNSRTEWYLLMYYQNVGKYDASMTIK